MNTIKRVPLWFWLFLVFVGYGCYHLRGYRNAYEQKKALPVASATPTPTPAPAASSATSTTTVTTPATTVTSSTSSTTTTVVKSTPKKAAAKKDKVELPKFKGYKAKLSRDEKTIAYQLPGDDSVLDMIPCGPGIEPYISVPGGELIYDGIAMINGMEQPLQLKRTTAGTFKKSDTGSDFWEPLLADEYDRHKRNFLKVRPLSGNNIPLEGWIEVQVSVTEKSWWNRLVAMK